VPGSIKRWAEVALARNSLWPPRRRSWPRGCSEGVLVKNVTDWLALTALVSVTLGVLTLTNGSATAAPTPVTPTASVAALHAGANVQRREQGGRYHVPTGAFFNDPRGGWPARLRIEHQIVRAINATKKGATISIAVYSFDRIPVARRLIAAAHRGVHLQMLVDNHQDTRAMKMVRAVIGTDRDKKSFIYKCRAGCRTDSPHGLLHSKIYMITKAGASKWALFYGSDNLTMNAARHQWNDLYMSSGNEALFNDYVGLFDDMKHDYNTEQPPYPTFCGIPKNGASCDDAVDSGTTVVFPRLVGPRNDPIVDILNRVQCITLTPDGKRVRTKLMVSMHTIRGRRGDYLADAYRRKFAEGCDARFSFGIVGARTKGHLAAKTVRGRMPLRSTGFDYHPDSDPVKNPDHKLDLSLDYYSHQKYLIIDGNYAGSPRTHLVFTGSSNWSGTSNDDILVNVVGRQVEHEYERNFNFEWHPPNSRNAYTTTYDHFRVAETHLRADGTTYTTYHTVTKKHVIVNPALVWHKGEDLGPYWEGD
jgi:phosphatidylserine/phosphatidylglycerophosphate/cardiolipin synthase-like enzyme